MSETQPGAAIELKPGLLHYNPSMRLANLAEWNAHRESWIRNLAENRRKAGSARDVGALFRNAGFRDSVAVLAAAGPSLPAAYEAIRTHRKSIRLLAVDAALAPLRAAGLEPDFVLVKNTSPATVRLLTDVGSTSRIGLIANLFCDPQILRRWKGSTYTFLPHCDIPELQALTAAEKGVTTLVMKPSSGTLLAILAHGMGFKRVVLAGFDFALTGGSTHAPGTRYLESDYPIPRSEDGRPVYDQLFTMQDIFLEKTTSCPEFYNSCEDLFAMAQYNGWENMFNSSLGGILFNVPWLYAEEAITGISAQARQMETMQVSLGNDPQMARSNDATIKLLGALIVRNTLDNRPTIERHLHIGHIYKRREELASRPAVVVGAAASLDDNLDTLRALRDEVRIFCVDASIHPLVAAGIRPDFAMTVDPQRTVAPFLTGYDTSGIGLVAGVTTHPDAIATWQGEIYFYWPLGYHKLFLQASTLLPDIPTLLPIQNCGSTSILFATSLGFRKIILIGVDFAYTNDRYYCRNVLHPNVEIVGREAILEARKDAFETKDARGDLVLSDSILWNYKVFLDKTLERFPGRIVNAGAGLLSFPHVPLEEAVRGMEEPPHPDPLPRRGEGEGTA